MLGEMRADSSGTASHWLTPSAASTAALERQVAPTSTRLLLFNVTIPNSKDWRFILEYIFLAKCWKCDSAANW